MTYPSNEPDLSAVCPHLGLADDADSHATYATEAHRCFKMPNPTRIAQVHQESYCLVAAHTTCPIYTGDGISRVAAPAAAAAGMAAPAAATPPAPAATAPGPRTRDRAQPAGAEEPPAPRPKRQRGADGQLQARPRAGGISMPAATIGLFALAIVLIAIAFLINRAVDDDGGSGNLSQADAFGTADANRTAQAAANQTPGQTQQNETPAGTQPANGTQTPGTTQTTTASAGGDEYTVVAGDTCSGIAEDNDVTLSDLLEANDMTEEDCLNLQEGDTLTIP
ncbi:MAG: LysM peptidoglycan-binding domain-containing protein [Dehalococcoidia bacterium]